MEEEFQQEPRMVVEETHQSERELIQKQHNIDAMDIFGSSDEEMEEQRQEPELELH